MLYEFQQINLGQNSSQTILYIVQNPRIDENGMNTAEIVGKPDYSNGFDNMEYVACQPQKFIFGGNFTLIEYTKELKNGSFQK